VLHILIISSHVVIQFWISWSGGVIQVGHNCLVGQDTFLSMTQAPTHTFDYLKIQTNSATGEWAFNTGMRAVIFTAN
jgi:hypothetical protein